MGLTKTVDIEATPEQVWTVLSDVEYWPEWTDSSAASSLTHRRAPGPRRARA